MIPERSDQFPCHLDAGWPGGRPGGWLVGIIDLDGISAQVGNDLRIYGFVMY